MTLLPNPKLDLQNLRVIEGGCPAMPFSATAESSADQTTFFLTGHCRGFGATAARQAPQHIYIHIYSRHLRAAVGSHSTPLEVAPKPRYSPDMHLRASLDRLKTHTHLIPEKARRVVKTVAETDKRSLSERASRVHCQFQSGRGWMGMEGKA